MNHEIPALMFVTLAVGVLVGIVLLLRFLRKSENRHPMADQRERNMDEIKRGDPPAGG